MRNRNAHLVNLAAVLETELEHVLVFAVTQRKADGLAPVSMGLGYEHRVCALGGYLQRVGYGYAVAILVIEPHHAVRRVVKLIVYFRTALPQCS